MKMNTAELFDQYAENYETALSQALRVSGENRRYFAEGRVLWLRRRLFEHGYSPRVILDFGCGDGSTTPLLLESFGAEAAIGTDISAESVRVAQSLRGTQKVTYTALSQFQPDGQAELAYCSGVFHHIPPPERADALALIKAGLRKGGWFGYWENNPWNPATRYVMANCDFDSDAITLTPRGSRKLLRENGFQVIRTDYRFIFPRFLKWARRAEDSLAPLPLGTQYMVLCRKPE
jgi:SAM-dependent methyltransferase